MSAPLPPVSADRIELRCDCYPLDIPLGDDAKFLIRQSWEKISSLGADQMKVMLMKNLHVLAAEVQQDTATATALASIAAIVEVEDLSHVSYMVQQIRQKHNVHGFAPKHYEAVSVVLNKTLAQILGDSFVPEVKAACLALYDIVASSLMGEPPRLEHIEMFLDLRRF